VKLRALAAYGIVVSAAIAADQWIKQWIETSFSMHEQVDILPFLALYRTHNTGISFSLFSGAGAMVLAAVILAVIGFVLWLASKTQPGERLARLGFALIVAGAVGNLIDRLMLGYVVDYFLFHTPIWSFAIFNLADALITVGAGLVILEELLAWRRERLENRAKRNEPPADG
jgi:signal peptidase II